MEKSRVSVTEIFAKLLNFLFLGLAKIGVVTALINFNLREDALLHCIESADAKAVIFGTELTAGTSISPVL